MNFIDTHIHIDLFEKPFEVLDFYEKNRIKAIFVTNLPEYFSIYYKKMTYYQHISLATGYHPGLLNSNKFDYYKFKENLDKTNFIGEVGLDFKDADNKSKKNQIDIFNKISALASQNNKIMSVHSKESEIELYEILISNNVKKAILHWYSGDPLLIKKFVDKNYYFSVNIKMLKTKKGKTILSEIPLTNILFETDAPFIEYKFDLHNFEFMYNLFNEFYNIKNFSEIMINNFKNLILK